MRFLIMVAVFGFLLVECSEKEPPPPPPPPPIKPAPGHLAALRIHVQNATQRAANEAKEEVCANTIYLRGAVQRSLVRAGYRVVVSADESRDLTARVSADWPRDKPGTATLSLIDASGAAVDQISGLVLFDSGNNLDERSAVALVEAMKHSPRLASFARAARSPQPTQPPPEGSAQVATSPSTPPGVGAPTTLQMSPEDRLRQFAPLFCGKVLAGDRAFMGAHIRLPLAVQIITNENYGNPINAKRSVTTMEGVAEFKLCKHVMGLDPIEIDPGMPAPTIRKTAPNRYEVTAMIGQFDAILEFMDTEGLFILVGYREQ